MWLWMKWHCNQVHQSVTVYRAQHFTWHQPCNNRRAPTSTPLPWILIYALWKDTVTHSESHAKSHGIALYKKAMNNNTLTRRTVGDSGHSVTLHTLHPDKLQALVYDILPLEGGAGKQCSECGRGLHRSRKIALKILRGMGKTGPIISRGHLFSSSTAMTFKGAKFTAG